MFTYLCLDDVQACHTFLKSEKAYFLFAKKNGKKGFRLIYDRRGQIAILAAIAIPQFSLYWIRGYNTAARADVKNAYTVAQVYFSDFPSVGVDLAKLSGSGSVGSASPAT